MDYSGKIQIIFGPMFSGKSTELVRRIKRYTIANMSCLVVKYINDNRYEYDSISTHDNITYSAFACSSLNQIKDLTIAYDVIGIDEGQFFPDIDTFSELMANMGKIIIIAALDGTFQRNPFNKILNLIPLAEEVIKLTSICSICCGTASFSKRIGTETEVEIIGGSDKYIAVCRSCYFK